MFVVVKLVLVIGPPTLPTRKFIAVFMVAIFFHIRVGKIHPRVIHTLACTMIHQILGVRVTMVLLVISEAVLVQESPTSLLKNTIFRDRKYWGFSNITEPLHRIPHGSIDK